MFKSASSFSDHLSNRTLLWSCGAVRRCSDPKGSVQARRGLVLQRSAAREKGVLEVVVEQAANGGHVDVSEARQSA